MSCEAKTRQINPALIVTTEKKEKYIMTCTRHKIYTLEVVGLSISNNCTFFFIYIFMYIFLITLSNLHIFRFFFRICIFGANLRNCNVTHLFSPIFNNKNLIPYMTEKFDIKWNGTDFPSRLALNFAMPTLTMQAKDRMSCDHR